MNYGRNMGLLDSGRNGLVLSYTDIVRLATLTQILKLGGSDPKFYLLQAPAIGIMPPEQAHLSNHIVSSV